MPELWEYKYRIKKFYKFDREEIISLFISVAVLAFIWAYNDHREVFNFAYWFANYIQAFAMFAIALFVHVSTQKMYGIYHGYSVEYKYWMTGLILGVIVTLLTNGYFPLLLPGGMVLMHLSRLRIGYFRFGLNTWQASQTAASGPYANVILVMFLKFVVWQLMGYESQWLDEFFKLNLILAVYTMLPIPPLPGIIAFFGSKLLYVYLFSLMLMYILLILIFGYYSLILGAALGGIIYFIYFFTVEGSK